MTLDIAIGHHGLRNAIGCAVILANPILRHCDGYGIAVTLCVFVLVFVMPGSVPDGRNIRFKDCATLGKASRRSRWPACGTSWPGIFGGRFDGAPRRDDGLLEVS